MALQTRQPTGAAGWPMLLVEGVEGVRKTSESLRLSADPRIGHAYVIEVGERRVDEYATMGRFEVVEHDGSLREIVTAIRDVMLLPPLEGKPTLLIIDSGTGLWDLVKRQAELYARSSREAKRILEADEHAEIPVGHQAWNRAKDPWWWSWLNDMRAWPGILVMTGRSGEVSKFLDGKPVAGQKDYRVEIESGTPFVFDATVRMRGPKEPIVTMGKSLKLMVKGIEPPFDLPKEHPLAYLIFDVLEAGTEVVLPRGRAQETLLAQARSLGWDADGARAAANTAWKAQGVGREAFDHKAMTALIGALPVPELAPPADPPPTDEFEVGDAEPGAGPIDPAPDAAPQPEAAPDVEPDVPATPAQEPAAPLEGEPGSDAPAEPPALTEAEDRRAFDVAPHDVLDDVLGRVRRMDTENVDLVLKAEGLPLTGNVATRRARLAARLVHRSALDARATA